MNVPEQERRELARLVTNLLEDYPKLREMVEEQIATPDLRPSIETLVERKTERLKRLQTSQDETAAKPDLGSDNSLR